MHLWTLSILFETWGTSAIQWIIKSIELPKDFVGPFKHQLRRTYEILNEESGDEAKLLKQQLETENQS